MDKVNKQELRRLAEAAKCGDWYIHGLDADDDRFTAAATPAAILSLLDECDGLLAQHSRDSAEMRALCQARDEARRERDQLRAELEQCRKDAERYRWLRDVAPATTGTVPMVSMADEAGGRVSGWIYGDKLDDKIEAAMAKEGGA